MGTLDVDVRHLDGEVQVSLAGVLDGRGVDDLDAHVRPLTGRYDASQMTFDCGRLASIDDRGVDQLLRLARICRGSGQIALRGVHAGLDPLLQRDETTDLFDIAGMLSS